MNEKDIARTIELGKSLEEVRRVQSELQGYKLDKARFEKNIVILKKANTEEQANYEAERKERGEEIAQLKNNIKILETKRANLATSTVPEIKKLQNLKAEMDKKTANMEREDLRLKNQAEIQRKEKNRIEDKKDILAQIAELTKKL